LSLAVSESGCRGCRDRRNVSISHHVAAASQHRILPTTKQGHTRRLLDDKIVYDAATNSGGSGALLFNRDGKVIGINFSVLRDFDGSNLALLVKYAKDLLK
jgi:S1-C subfamily serine protease